MKQVILFKTVFVKMTKNPQTFTRKLGFALNELSMDDWETFRYDVDLTKGALLVARKVDPEALKERMAAEGNPLSTLFEGLAKAGPIETSPDLSPSVAPAARHAESEPGIVILGPPGGPAIPITGEVRRPTLAELGQILQGADDLDPRLEHWLNHILSDADKRKDDAQPLKTATENMCRRYPNPTLRAILDELNGFVRNHSRRHTDESQCAVLKTAREVAEHVQKHIQATSS